ncbi:MAG: hypothetical protein JSU69_05955 [Candidatus Zixiibacteriota bacterium]|nr:MAG: hypothetical protein JSU69_05955 [candidate division Zixibacteria bacterium]
MRKLTAILVTAVFVVTLLTSVIVSTSEAKPPRDCYYKCVNGLGYFCCIVDGEEQCQYDPKIDCIRW